MRSALFKIYKIGGHKGRGAVAAVKMSNTNMIYSKSSHGINCADLMGHILHCSVHVTVELSIEWAQTLEI